MFKTTKPGRNEPALTGGAGIHPIGEPVPVSHHPEARRLREHFCRHVGGECKQTTNKNIMTTLEIKGDWNITKGKLKQKWATLTDDDLQYAEGKQEELFGRIQKRTGQTREAVEKAVKESCAICAS